MSNIRTWLAEKSSEERELFLGEVPRLWLEGGQVKKLCRLLSDFDFIEAKINHSQFGVQALIEDYDLIDEAKLITHPEYDVETVKALKLIQGALQLSAHIFNEDNTQLVEQLWGRLQCFDAPDIQALLKQAKQWKQIPWLRPLTASLNRPDGRLLKTLTGHTNSVNAIAIRSDGKQVISGSSDNTLKIWDLESGKAKHTLVGHSDSVNAIAITPNGKQVISASSDTTLKVWNVETGKEERTFTGHTKSVCAIAVTPDGSRLVSASKDKKLKIWNFQTEKEEREFPIHGNLKNSIIITPDSQEVIVGDVYDENIQNLGKNYLIVRRNYLTIWNLETGKKSFIHVDDNHLINAVTITSDGKQLISGSLDSTLKIWDLESKIAKISFPFIGTFLPKKLLFTFAGHQAPVQTVTVTTNNKQIISGSWDNTLKVWNLKNGKELFTFTGHGKRVNTVAVSPDSKLVISASDDKTLKIWNLEIEEEQSTFIAHENSSVVTDATSNSKYSASNSSNQDIKILNRETGEEVLPDTTRSNSINSVAVTPDNQQVIAGYANGNLKIFNLQTGEKKYTIIAHKDSVNTVSLTFDGSQIISSALDKTIKSWHLQSHQNLFIFKSLSTSLLNPLNLIKYIYEKTTFIRRNKFLSIILLSLLFITLSTRIMLKIFVVITIAFTKKKITNPVAITPNGKFLVSSSRYGTPIAWNLKTGKKSFFLKSLLRSLLQEIKSFMKKNIDVIFFGICTLISYSLFTKATENANSISDIHKFADFQLTASVYLFVFRGLLSLLVTKDIQRDHVTSVAITSDGKKVIFASSDNTLKVWCLRTGKQVDVLTSHSAKVNAIAITPNDEHIISGSSDNNLKVWDLKKGEVIFTLTGHNGEVNAVAIIPDSKLVVSGSSDNTLRVWDLFSRKEIASFSGDSELRCCAVAPDGVTIVAGEASGRLHLLRLEGIEV